MVLTVSANVSGIVADIEDIYLGEDKLTITTDYTIDDDEITLKKETLKTLEEGEYIVTVVSDNGIGKAKIIVIDTEE